MQYKYAKRISIAILSTLSLGHTAAYAQDWGNVKTLQDFIGRDSVVTNATAIESSGLMKSQLAERPWSSTYWADMMGSVDRPYAQFNPSISPLSWKLTRRALIAREDLRKKGVKMSDKEIDRLSPAEKYDLLLGDENFTFTHQVMKRIDDLDAAGQVAPWSGVCHGWSPASLTLARPGHKFYLTARNGRMIPFYPSDVKALASFLWGESFAQNSVKISGWQCSDPENQSENGRFLDPRCFDPNPAFFHLVTLNQIGLNRRGFVMDRSYHSEVQNQPVYGYEFKYFKFTDSHPIPEAKMTVQEAKVSRKDVSWDPYDDHRSPRAVSLLGVEAKIQYALENQPNHHPTDSVKEDNQDTLYLYYDLELDANNEIVGGEWHHFDDPTHHTDMDEMAFAKPDLLWLVPQGLKAWSIADADISSVPWDGMGTAPEAWTQAAIKAATGTIQKSVGGKDYTIANPQPLAYVVDLLIQMSRK